MPCDRVAARCRAELGGLFGLEPNPRSSGDWEGPCPECRHGGFALSAPTKNRLLRHIWACNCKRCPCGGRPGAGIVRVAMLRGGADRTCLGDYSGPEKTFDEDAARKLALAVDDILATPGFRPADIRILLAEARGQKAPSEFTEFVKFAKRIGIGKTQAQEAAARLCRPSDCPPSNRGGRQGHKS